MTNLDNPIVRFWRGFFCPIKSLGFIRRNPTLYKYVVVPFIINVTAFCLVIYLGFSFFQEKAMAMLPQGDAWYWLILNYFFMILAALVILVLVFFSFAVVGSLIASPFNDLLSERTEALLLGRVDGEPFSLTLFWRDSIRVLWVECKKILVFLVGMIALLGLHLVPVLGVILYPVLSVIWSSFFLVMEYNGYVFVRKRLDFKAQRREVFDNFAVMAGFGLGLFCLLAIPFLQFLCIPLGVVGAVRLLAESGFYEERN